MLEPEEAADVPGPDIGRTRIDVDGEVEVVAHGDAHLPVRARAGRLEDVEALDDEDVRAADGDAGAGDDVVRVVRVDGGADLRRSGLHGGQEAQQAAPVVGFREALAAAEAAAGQLCVGEQEAVGREQLDAGGVRPARQHLSQQACGRRLAHRDGPGHADDEGRALGRGFESLVRQGGEELAGDLVLLAAGGGVQVEQAGQREVDGLHLLDVDALAQAAQPGDIRRGQGQRGRVGQAGPLLAREVPVRRLRVRVRAPAGTESGQPAGRIGEGRRRLRVVLNHAADCSMSGGEPRLAGVA